MKDTNYLKHLQYGYRKNKTSSNSEDRMGITQNTHKIPMETFLNSGKCPKILYLINQNAEGQRRATTHKDQRAHKQTK